MKGDSSYDIFFTIWYEVVGLFIVDIYHSFFFNQQRSYFACAWISVFIFRRCDFVH